MKQPVIFSKLSTLFLLVGNHGDISRFLQEIINHMETMLQQSVRIYYAKKIHVNVLMFIINERKKNKK
jgi:hypothetical protein